MFTCPEAMVRRTLMEHDSSYCSTPLVIPVLGGLLAADEVIDLFLPVRFYRIRLSRVGAISSP